MSKFTRLPTSNNRQAAVSCSLSAYCTAGVKMGLGLTGKLGNAWFGAWVGAWAVHGGGDGVLCFL